MSNRSKPLALFFRFLLLTFGITWAFWIPAALGGQDVRSFPTILIQALGGIGPSLAGIILVWRTLGSDARRDFWRRTVDFKRIRFRQLLAILLVFPLITLVSVWSAGLLGAELPAFEGLKQLALQPLVLIPAVIMAFLNGALPEELGWRGYGLDTLRLRFSPVGVTLLLGFFWGLWHLPLFFIQGTTQYSIGIGSLSFWLFLLNSFSFTALMVWFYNRTQRSILSAILMHFSINFFANLLYPISTQASIIQSLLLLAALGVVLALQAHRQPVSAQNPTSMD